MPNPNLRIVSIEQKSSTEIGLTIQAALFVWIDFPEQFNGYFSQNGFHMFEQQMIISFTSWSILFDFHPNEVELTIMSLYDLIQP